VLVRRERVGGRRIEVHEDRFGARRYWAKVDDRTLFQRGRMRVRMFTTPEAARRAALGEGGRS
jgi:hypothetical protein